jgi:hypothetical protein
LNILYLSGNNELASLPLGIFAELCSLSWLGINGIDSAAFADNAFAGWPYCDTFEGEPGVREMCEAQQGLFVEGSCEDQLCETGDCSACYSEGSCGSYVWCSWSAGSCGAPECAEGKEPNVEVGACEACEPGKYSSTISNDACSACAAGKFSEVVGSVSADDCLECEAGKVTGMDGSLCVPVVEFAATADHGWDFRGCSDSAPVMDSAAESELKATLMNGACTAEGVSLDGVDDYVDIDDWEWGGATSFEMLAKYESFNNYSPVFCFGNGEDGDSVYVANRKTVSTIYWSVRQGDSKEDVREDGWDQSSWTHVVVTVSGTTMKIHKNGVLLATDTDGHEPLTMTRTKHWLGRPYADTYSNGVAGYFNGTVAFVRVWHGVELGEDDVEQLYLERGIMN